MKKKFRSFHIHSPRRLDRRSFLTKSGSAGLGVTGLAATLANMKLMSDAVAGSSGMNMSEYKVMICFFLSGGCDTNNTLIPIGNHPGRSNYEDDRKFVAVPEADIANAGTSLNVSEFNGTPYGGNIYGLHPSCTAMANHFNAGKLAMIANCGTLAVPIQEGISRDDYRNITKPIQLFSHSDQVNEWFSSIPQNPFISGWAGRVADLFKSSPSYSTVNQDSRTSMLITAAGTTDLLVTPGGSLPQFAVNRTGAVSFSGYGTNYSSGLSGGKYRDTDTGRRLQAFEALQHFQHEHILEQGYNTVIKSARDNEETIGAATSVADGITTNGGVTSRTGRMLDDIFLDTYSSRTGSNFSNPTQLPNDMEELLMICKLIAGRECLGNTRQVFFLNKGGFDNHSNINDNLPVLLRDVDIMVDCFIKCMNAIAAEQPDFDSNMATLFEASDFNRTWTPNSSGTDHAWGTHTFCCGGAVEDAITGGGAPSNLKIHGKFPVLEIKGPNDVPGGNTRGRWVPQISTDQYYARLAKWFGVSNSDMNTIFPNLANGFADPLTHPGLDFLPAI